MTPTDGGQTARRAALQQAIAALPDEAFSYLALALWPRPPRFTTQHMMWPDGLGGFLPASQAGILAVLDAATWYCTEGADGYVEPGAPDPNAPAVAPMKVVPIGDAPKAG